MTIPRSIYGLSVAAPAADVYGLASNTWQQVTLGTSQRYIPRLGEPATVLENQSDPVSREFGGFSYGNGKLYFFGGGHSGYPGNDVEVYDMVTKTWTQSYNPDVCLHSDGSCNMIYDGGYAPAVAPSGRPYTEHTFEKLTWNPSTNLLWAILGAGTFTYDPVTKIWTSIGPKLVGPDITNSNLLIYDPDVGAILATLTGDSPTGQIPGVYKLISGTWTRQTSVPSFNRSTDAYMPDHHKHLVLFTFDLTWWIFDAVALTWTAATAPPATVDSFDYDTKNHLVIGVQHQPTGVLLFSYNPNTDAWTTMSNPTTRPTQPAGGPNAANPIFRYDPINNVFIFLRMEGQGGGSGSGGVTETWAYRYA